MKEKKSKITYIGREKSIQKYAQAVSSVGGAIAGGILFGGIGAAIGGAAYSGEFQAKRTYLVITYVNEEENVKYIIFDYKDRAQNLIKDFELFNKTNIQKRTVEIKQLKYAAL